MLIYKYLHNNDQTVTLGAIDEACVIRPPPRARCGSAGKGASAMAVLWLN